MLRKVPKGSIVAWPADAGRRLSEPALQFCSHVFIEYSGVQSLRCMGKASSCGFAETQCHTLLLVLWHVHQRTASIAMPGSASA